MRTGMRHQRTPGVLIRPASLIVLLLLSPAGARLAAQSALPGQESVSGMAPDSTGLHDPGFARIFLIAQVRRDSVVLRWAPSTAHGWRVANRTGYVVERRGTGGGFVRLTPDTLHPWLPMKFIDEMRTHQSNQYLGLVLNALWADSALLGLEGADTLRENAARNVNLYGFALFAADNDPYIADAMGLRFVDRAATTGERYTYRVRLNEERDYRIDPGEAEVDVRPTPEGPPPANLTARAVERRIELRWDPQRVAEYTGYLVSRSEDGGRTFRQLNARPIVIVTGTDSMLHAQGGYTDTSVAQHRTYVYRVQGITPFGDRGAAAEVRALVRDLTPPPPPRVHNPKLSGKSVVRLEWDMPATSPDLAGFVVSRSALSDSLFHDLTAKPLPKTARQFTDSKADPAEPYYIISSVDTAGNRAPSFPLMGAQIDTVPPAVPAGLRGQIEPSGIVHLSWHGNRERDILGYRVLRANDLRHEFTQLTGKVWRDTAFTDTVEVRTLTRSVYYEVAAVNARFNHSRATAPLALRRPDVNPPVPPAFSDVQASDSAVTLRWVPSGSRDVQSHVLSRRAAGTGEWKPVATLPRTASVYVDREVTQNVMYEYRIEAVDSSGLRSQGGLTVQGRPYDTGVRPAVADVAASFDPKENCITVTWKYTPARPEKSFFLVYRSRDGAPLARYRSVESSVKTFTDREVEPGAYEYAIQFVTRGGAQSSPGARARVQVPKPGQ